MAKIVSMAGYEITKANIDEDTYSGWADRIDVVLCTRRMYEMNEPVLCMRRMDRMSESWYNTSDHNYVVV